MEKSKFNRAKFKDTISSEDLKAADKAVEDVVRRGQQGHYAGFLDIEAGINKFLLYPSHEAIQQMMSDENVDNEPFVVSKQIFWLPREVEEKDDNNNVKKDRTGKPILKIKNRPVFDARIHSDSKKDIVDWYIQCLKAQFVEQYGDDDDVIKEKMLPIYGSYQRKVMGIVGKPSWIVYAQKMVSGQKIFGRLEIGKAVKMRINELIAIEESNQAIGSESNNPFTDIDDRRAITIKYNKDADDARLYYITEIDTSYDPETKVLNTYPLTDEELEEFLEYPSLSSLYKNHYTQQDFDNALEGLKLFDDEHEFDVFSNADFLDEAEQMRDLYPEPDEESEGMNEEGEGEGDKFDVMDRTELKQYARINKAGIAIHSKITDDELRDMLRDFEKDGDGDEVKDNENEEEPTETEPEAVQQQEVDDKKESVVETKERKLSAKERIAQIRNKGKK